MMKKIYLKPEIKEVTIFPMQILAGSKKINIGPDPENEEDDDEVDDFDQLL